ncbi:hypothetical protein GCM10010168_90560 [Actinoplanes ianthinogenes]|uniref:DUF6879 domain-containing protein n=1 Tax=Actinoplanes ianthinogenes TaxID=122358 RepID=A0ABM7LSU5_9ACTN|nr:DUF6879 family protein [Actinoplanes ianthinogenes]BCJ42331.1 hypothetical protein Aiant_29880 [Actinoplanes ianthinogenes]GGR57589.1 hypothetical protein GCM10010168_90560 [Actinoplanes ianthinogenes]
MAAAGTKTDVLRLTLATIASGGVTFLLTNALNQPLEISLLLSVLIGGIVLIVRFLIMFEERLTVVESRQLESLREINVLVDRKFSEINKATELFHLIESSAMQHDVLAQLVRQSTGILPSSPPIIHNLAESRLRELGEFMGELSEGGETTYYGEDRDWLLGLAQHTTTSLDAISTDGVDRGFWNSDIGRHYLEYQRQAVERGVRIRRIFLLPHPEMASQQDFVDACRYQGKMGIDVRVLDHDDIPHAMKPSIVDFIIFDAAVGYETMSASTTEPDARPVLAQTRLIMRERRVKELANIFEHLWRISRPLEAATPGPEPRSASEDREPG